MCLIECLPRITAGAVLISVINQSAISSNLFIPTIKISDKNQEVSASRRSFSSKT